MFWAHSKYTLGDHVLSKPPIDASNRLPLDLDLEDCNPSSALTLQHQVAVHSPTVRFAAPGRTFHHLGDVSTVQILAKSG